MRSSFTLLVSFLQLFLFANNHLIHHQVLLAVIQLLSLQHVTSESWIESSCGPPSFPECQKKPNLDREDHDAPVVDEVSEVTDGASGSNNSSVSDRNDCPGKEYECTSETACRIAHALYKLNCHATSLKAVTCTLCKVSRRALAVIPKGGRFLSCDCGQDTDCKLSRSRVTDCLNG